jgi:tetrahydromethanopterin S-methyltransferase subunit D
VWLCRAQVALLWATVLVRTRPAGHLVRHAPAAGAPAAAPESVVREARMLALAVGRAAEHGPIRAACLVRSVALQRLLQRRGITGSRIQIGVRMNEGRFVAHAWVEWNGEVIGDHTAHTSTFAQLCDVDLAPVQ